MAQGFEIALVVYDDHHHFQDLPFSEWTSKDGLSLLACGIVLEEDEKWLKLLADYNFEHKDEDISARSLVKVILKSAITYERRFRVQAQTCLPVDGMMLAYRNMKQEEETP